MTGITFDKEKASFNLARLKKAGEVFEVVVDSDLAIAMRQGRDVDIKDVLKADKIFHDAKKGLFASEKNMEQVFGTSDPDEVAKVIIKEGEIQLTAEYRQKLREEKLKQIIRLIHVNGVDPKTRLPHPVTRIENAINEAKVHIDEHKSAEAQVDDVLKGIRAVLPIKFEVKDIQIHIPAEHAPKCYSVLHSMGRLVKEEWQNDGSLLAVTEIPGGLEEELYEKLNKVTHGDIETKVLR